MTTSGRPRALSLSLFAVSLTLASVSQGQLPAGPTDRLITFPNVAGYHTLTTDLHMHTVFSDGDVWPSVRVQEALRDGIDIIAITEHIELQPHRGDLPNPDRNRAYEIALREARDSDLIVLNGSEITRKMPPGHANAVFVQDANRLIQDDSIAVYEEALRQGAFVFWNHPTWIGQQKNAIATLAPVHERLISEGLLHGVEVVNELTYSEEALQIALDHDLTIIGTSDVHGLIDWAHNVPFGGHRPVTLVFAEQRSAESAKEALFAGRTVVWYENLLVGRDKHLLPLLEASVVVHRAAYLGRSSVLNIYLDNRSDVEYMLYNRSEFTFYDTSDLIRVLPQAVTRLQVKTIDRVETLSMRFEVLNAITAPGVHPELSLKIDVAVPERVRN